MSDKELFNKFVYDVNNMIAQNKYAKTYFDYDTFKNLGYSLDEYTKCVNYFENQYLIERFTMGGTYEIASQLDLV